MKQHRIAGLRVGLVVVWVGVLWAGCATTQRPASGSTMSPTAQRVLTMAVDRALAQADFAQLAGEKVYVDLVGYTQGPEAPFIRQKIREKVEAAGGSVVPDKEMAATYLEANLLLTGTDVENRRIPILTHSEEVPGTVRMTLSYYDLPGGEKTYEKTVSGYARYKETKFLGIGPFRSYD